MQTRIGLRTVRKSTNDINHGVPQAVSPFHPPVKLNDEPLKQPAVEEKKRSSSRLSNQRAGQTTLHEFQKLETTQSTKKSIGKKRSTTTKTINEHKSKKQRVLDFGIKESAAAQETTVQKEEPVAESTVALVVEPTVEPTVEPIVEPTAESAVESVIEPAIEPTAEPAVEPVADRTVEPIAELVVESVAEHKAKKQRVVVEKEHPVIEHEVSPRMRETLPLPQPTVEAEKIMQPSNKSTVAIEPTKEPETPKPVEAAQCQQEKIAPWKRSFFVESDEARVQEEKNTLSKLRNDLDTTIMFQLANNYIPMFYKMQPMLRNTTKKNITISHVAKILYVAPVLYRVNPKELKVNGKMIETYSMEFGKDWKAPLSGKQLEERKTLLADKMESYFAENKGKLVIPEAELPRIEKVVDKSKWLETAKMPSGMRDLLQLEERRKEKIEQDKATLPPITGTGSAKDRRKALLERIRAKSKK